MPQASLVADVEFANLFLFVMDKTNNARAVDPDFDPVEAERPTLNREIRFFLYIFFFNFIKS